MWLDGAKRMLDLRSACSKIVQRPDLRVCSELHTLEITHASVHFGAVYCLNDHLSWTVVEVVMSCSSHQSLFDSDKRISEAWKRLNGKINRSVSETDEMYRLARAADDSSQAVTDHIADCFECGKETDVTAS
jgi:hypothetical protein